MKNRHRSIFVILPLIIFVLTGCFRHEPVRHLAAEAALITPHQTTKQEVLSYLGEPEERQSVSENREVWIYYQADKSLLRKTPLVGNKMGNLEYDVLNVSFTGDVADNCVYRRLDEETFRQGIEGEAQ